MEISACVKYVGVNDHQVDLFEGQYKVPNGMSYNSYVILDDKIAVMDTVDGFFTEEWLNNVEQVLDGKMPDYLVIQHMEPDHSASIPAFLKNIPKPQWYPQLRDFSSWNSFSRSFSPCRDYLRNNASLRRMMVSWSLDSTACILSMLPWCIGRRS